MRVTLDRHQRGKGTNALDLVAELEESATVAADWETVVGELIQLGEPSGDIESLHSMAVRASASAWLERQAAELSTVAADPTGDPLDRAIEVAQRIVMRKAGRAEPPADLIYLLDELGHDMTMGVSRRGILSGFPLIDDATAGMHRGVPTIVGARPGVGKTAFMVNAVVNTAAQYKTKALICSLEMTGQQLAMRVAGVLAGLHQDDAMRGNKSKAALPGKAADMLRQYEADVQIYSPARATVSDIAAAARRCHSDRGLDLLVVDYIQLIRTTQSFQNREREVAYITQELCGTAKELNCGLLAINQLNRMVEGRKDPKPKMSDLRDSGQLEQDAASILFLYKEEDDAKSTMCHVAKARFGKPGKTIELGWNGETQRMVERGEAQAS